MKQQVGAIGSALDSRIDRRQAFRGADDDSLGFPRPERGAAGAVLDVGVQLVEAVAPILAHHVGKEMVEPLLIACDRAAPRSRAVRWVHLGSDLRLGR